MFTSKTVFILGAGASHEVGFPLGSALREIISEKLDFQFDYSERPSGKGDSRIYAILNDKYRGQQIIQSCLHIRDGIILSDSIDDFIDANRHDSRIAICGKLAIASSILEAERKSKVFVDQGNIYNTIDFKAIQSTWYLKFYSLLTKQLAKSDIDKVFENVIVVNFNYDRSLEHFLKHAFCKHYNISAQEVTQLIDKLIIFRPYGSVGKYIEFGSNNFPRHDELISSLKTYTEQVEDREGLNQVKQAIQDAEVLVFLGMAYHPNNMNLLQTSCEKINKKIYATRVGISDEDLPVIRRRIMNLMCPDSNGKISKALLSKLESNNILFANECSALFDKYRYSLSEHYIS